MKILVPVDGSPASLNAAKKAVEIAKQYKFSIKIINVLDYGNISSHKRNEKLWRRVDGTIIATKGELDEMALRIKQNASKMLDVIIEDLDFSGINVEKDVLLGEPYLKILEVAEKEKFDLIVMGNRGFSKIKSFFLGSVSQRVIAEAKCPVLVIHSDPAI